MMILIDILEMATKTSFFCSRSKLLSNTGMDRTEGKLCYFCARYYRLATYIQKGLLANWAGTGPITGRKPGLPTGRNTFFCEVLPMLRDGLRLTSFSLSAEADNVVLDTEQRRG